jgi:hypothetical protein
MIKTRLVLLLLIFTHFLYAQKVNSRIKIFDKDGKFGATVGKKTILLPLYKEIRLEENGLIAVKDSIGLWGYFNDKGTAVVSPRFVETKAFKNNRALVKKEDGWGIMTKEGNYVLKPVYKTIAETEDESIEALPFQEIIVLNSKKDTVTSFLTDSITSISRDIYAYFLDGKCGLLDKSGNKITLPLYDSIGKYVHNLVLAKKDNKWGALDNFGKEIIPTHYDFAEIDSSNFIRVLHSENQEEKWYLFDSKGKSVFSESINYIGKINGQNNFVYKSKGKYGIMRTSSEEVLKPIYNYITESGDFFLVQSDEGFGLLSQKLKWLYRPYADSIKLLSGKNVIYKFQDNYHLLDSAGREKICSKAPLHPLADGLLESRNANKIGRITYSGKEVLLPVYDSIMPLTKDSGLVAFTNRQIAMYNFNRDTLIGPNDRLQEIFPVSEGFWGVKIKGKYGFIDNMGRIRIANRYDGVGQFKNGFAPVKLLGKWGVIDKAEILRVQPTYDEVQDFQNGLVIVKKDGKYGILNKSGQIVTNFLFDGFERTIDNYFISVKKNNKNLVQKGLISSEGKELIFAKYDDIIFLKNGNAIVKKNNQYGVVSKNDLIIFSTIYKNIEYDATRDNYILIKEKPKEIVKLGRNQ